MILNAQNIAVLFQAYSAAFKGSLTSTVLASQFEQLATVVPSTTASNTYAWLGTFPRLREWLGDRQFKNLTAYGYSVVNKLFESSVQVPRTAIEDDQYGVYSPQFVELGRSAAMHPNELVFAALTAGLTTGLGYDGVPFFSSAHPMTDANGVTTTFSNLIAGPGNAWFLMDTTRAIKPMLFQKRSDYELQLMNKADDERVFMSDEYRFGVRGRCNVGYGLPQMALACQQPLTTANFDLAAANMMAQKDDQGRPLGIQPKILLCGPSNRAAALQVIKSEYIATPAGVVTSGTAATGGNSNYNMDIVDLLISPYLP